jgi:hypothetical protein
VTKRPQHTDGEGNGSSAAELLVEPLGDDRWEWRYVEAATGVQLHSNENYASAEEAAEWARRAYPDLSVAGHDN